MIYKRVKIIINKEIPIIQESEEIILSLERTYAHKLQDTSMLKLIQEI